MALNFFESNIHEHRQIKTLFCSYGHAQITQDEYKPGNNVPNRARRARYLSAPILTHPAIQQSSHNRSALTSDQIYNQTKKGTAVKEQFHDKKFTSAPKLAADSLVIDFKFCSIQKCLDEP